MARQQVIHRIDDMGASFYGREATALARTDPTANRFVSLSPAIAQQLQQQAQAAWPAECAAILGGHRASPPADGHLTIRQLVVVPNRSAATDRFVIDPADFAAALRAFADRDQQWLGFAHSHPGGSTALSTIDRRELWTGCLQTIIAPQADGSCPRAHHWAEADGDRSWYPLNERPFA